jgi:hypothetical protein
MEQVLSSHEILNRPEQNGSEESQMAEYLTIAEALKVVIRPRIPRPPAYLIDVAKRDIPELLTDRSFGVAASTLAMWLKMDHGQAAADHAIFDLISENRLRAELVDPLPIHWQRDRDFQVIPTQALWEWWSSLQHPSVGQGAIDTSPEAFDQMVPIASDVPDLGVASTVPEFWQWCDKQRNSLQGLRSQLGEPPPASVAVDRFRLIPEIVHQCRRYLTGFCAPEIPQRFAFASLPRDQTPSESGVLTGMAGFLAWASGYRQPGHCVINLIGEVEEFLTWAMAWASRAGAETKVRAGGRVPKRGRRAAKIEKLTQEMNEHLRAARDHAFFTRETSDVPELLPRPTQKELSARTGLSESDVSRCLKDKKAKELQICWHAALDVDQVMRC